MSHGKWNQMRTTVLAFLIILVGLVERGASADDGRPYCRHAWAIKISKAIVQSDNETPSAP